MTSSLAKPPPLPLVINRHHLETPSPPKVMTSYVNDPLPEVVKVTLSFAWLLCSCYRKLTRILFGCSKLAWFRFLDLVAIIIDYLSTSYIATGQIKCYLLAGCILSAQCMSCERTVHQHEIAHSSGCTVLPPARRCWYGTLYSTPLSIYVHMSASWFI